MEGMTCKDGVDFLTALYSLVFHSLILLIILNVLVQHWKICFIIFPTKKLPHFSSVLRQGDGNYCTSGIKDYKYLG